MIQIQGDSEETWAEIPGYDGWYDVSSLGRVRSWRMRGKGAWRRSPEPRVLRQGRGGGGRKYCTVHPIRVTGEPPDARLVHHLVIEAFVGPRPDGLFVCHNNGDSFDNRIENLRYDTFQSNEDDKQIHGTRPSGVSHGNSKMTCEIARFIYSSPETGVALARKYGVTPSAVCTVRKGRAWGHATGHERGE